MMNQKYTPRHLSQDASALFCFAFFKREVEKYSLFLLLFSKKLFIFADENVIRYNYGSNNKDFYR